MKIIKFTAAILLSIGLIGCANTDAEDKNNESEIIETEEVVENDVAALSSNEDDYVQEVIELSSTLEMEFMNFSDLSLRLSNDITLLYDDSFVLDLALTITQIDAALDNILKLDPPSKFAESDDLMKKSAHEYKFMTENYPEAIDNLDVDLLDEINVKMENGNNYINQATEIVGGIE